MPPHSATDVYLPGRSLGNPAARRALGWAVWCGYLVGVVVLSRVVDPGLRTTVVLPLAFLPLVATTALGAVRKHRVARYNLASAAATAQLQQGNLGVAERELARIEREFAWPRLLANLARYNRALAVLRQGRHDDAVALLAETDRRGGGPGIDAALASTLGYEHALRGDLESSAAWLIEAGRRGAGRGPIGVFGTLLAEVALELRRGRCVEVRLRLENDWPAIENALKGESLRPLRVFRAFAIAEASGVRGGGAVDAALAALRPNRPGEFGYLAAAWPELGRFLAVYLPGPGAADGSPRSLD